MVCFDLKDYSDGFTFINPILMFDDVKISLMFL